MSSKYFLVIWIFGCPWEVLVKAKRFVELMDWISLCLKKCNCSSSKKFLYSKIMKSVNKFVYKNSDILVKISSAHCKNPFGRTIEARANFHTVFFLYILLFSRLQIWYHIPIPYAHFLYSNFLLPMPLASHLLLATVVDVPCRLTVKFPFYFPLCSSFSECGMCVVVGVTALTKTLLFSIFQQRRPEAQLSS